MSVYNGNITVSLFGESHGDAVGVCISNFHAGMELDTELINSMLERRKADGILTTPRKESDKYKIISGVTDGITNGFPICAIFENLNVKSGDYQTFRNTPRPSHADYTARLKYGGFADMSGGGHFSGRLTLPLTFAGALCKQALYEQNQTEINADIAEIGGAKQNIMAQVINAKNDDDSIGAIVRICAKNVLPGLGGPLFESAKSKISGILFAIPGVAGVSFGLGFELAGMMGSEANDELETDGENIAFISNNSGGINGGITNGSEIIVNVAFKPTASIAKEQRSVNLSTMKNEKLTIIGRHDPCIALRGCVVCEAALALALYDLSKGAK